MGTEFVTFVLHISPNAKFSAIFCIVWIYIFLRKLNIQFLILIFSKIFQHFSSASEMHFFKAMVMCFQIYKTNPLH